MLPIIPSDVDWSFILVAFVWSIWPAQEMLLMMCDVWLPFFLQCPSSPLLKLLFLAVRYWLCCLLLSYHASLDWSALPEVLLLVDVPHPSPCSMWAAWYPNPSIMGLESIILSSSCCLSWGLCISLWSTNTQRRWHLLYKMLKGYGSLM